MGPASTRWPAVDHHHVLAHPLDVVEQVGGEDGGDAEPGQAADQLEHLLPAHRVEPGGGLVQQHQLRVGHQRLGELGALAHAGGEAAHGPEAGLVQAHEVEHVRRPLAGGPGGQAGQLAEGRHDVGCGLVERQALVLGHVAEAAAHGHGIGVDPVPGHLEDAVGGAHEPEHQPEQRGLARAVGPDQAHRARRHVDGQPGQGGDPVGIGHGQAGSAEHRGRGRRLHLRQSRAAGGR